VAQKTTSLAVKTIDFFKKPSLTILCFHRIAHGDKGWLNRYPTTDGFRWRIEALARTMRVIGLEEGLDALYAGTLKGSAAAITFDDGYLDNLEYAVPVLSSIGVPATFFVSSGFIGSNGLSGERLRQAFYESSETKLLLPEISQQPFDLTGLNNRMNVCSVVNKHLKYLCFSQRDLLTNRVVQALKSKDDGSPMLKVADLKKLNQLGMAVGSHSHNHVIATTAKSNQDWLADLNLSRQSILEATGKSPSLFAFPNGKFGDDYLPSSKAIVEQAGFKYALTTDIGIALASQSRFSVPRFTPWQNTAMGFKLRLLFAQVSPATSFPS
jgi:peptidoglycan/xylan/chitin deacetylase (PgdA/CDA1 family)